MNGYVCFWRDKRFECRAPTTYRAQQIAASHWRVKPSQQYQISVVLAELGEGKTPVVHTAVD